MDSQLKKEWHVKLKVSLEEEQKIKKDAIDYEMKVGEYIKFKALTEFPESTRGKRQ